ncbi:thiolase family protein [Paraburkholderia sp. MM5384-R2]|uniref:thiolase family protein n=1 Tax=Paraburkholderia sp. MM5384-R2 TaxID=2723097 RepID=UPI00160AD8A9|nr:thiolase family protein [Paraburkholderia sp. MM5384-R2]MBB5498810.1 acetyl-CoA acetyltransferase [Paraburkholderia sp. MM5384-R2]
MNNAYVAGVGMTRLGKFVDRSVKDLVREAVNVALDDAQLDLAAIEGAWFANSRQGQMEGQNSIRGQCALRSMGFQGISIINVENACAGGSTAFNQALVSVLAGQYDVVIAVGADKLVYPDKKDAMFKAFSGGIDVHLAEQFFNQLAALGQSIVPAGIVGEMRFDAPGRSFFMDIYAGLSRQHMARFGTTREQIAAIAAKNHRHSVHNSHAQYRKPMSTEEVLADAPVVWPFTRSMCSPMSDGAAAVVLVSDRARRRLGTRRAVQVASSVIVSGLDRDPGDYDRHTGRMAALRAYEQAGVGPEDMGLAELHDATAFAEVLQSENLGFCARGEGGIFAESGATTLGGRIPINVSGGLISKGHPIGATGIVMVRDVVTQLRGEAGAAQVSEARFGVVENGGGFWGVEEAATAVHVLGPLIKS